MSIPTSIERLRAIKTRIRTNLAAQGITVPEDTVLSEMAERILSVAGEDGRGIVSMTRTSGTGESGSTDTYTITYTDETTNTFSVYNGKDGTSDMDWIPTKDWDEGSTLYEAVLSFTGSMATIPSGRTFSIQPAINYRVYWNGVLYECTGKTYDDQPYLGNGRLVHGNYVEDTGEPFGFIAKIFGYDAVYVNKSVSAPEDITVKITTGVYTYNTMPDEYLPAGVVKSVNGLVPDENGNVAIASMLPDIGSGGSSSQPSCFTVPVTLISGTATYTPQMSFEEVYSKISMGYTPVLNVSEEDTDSVEVCYMSRVSADQIVFRRSGVPVEIIWSESSGMKAYRTESSTSVGTSIDVTAQVGQTIVVKEVDANGKPTAWEAVDYQPRTHWSETGTAAIMPETTVEIDPESFEGMALVDFALEPNKPYTIKYNGVEYPDCVGVDLGELGLGFGNLGGLDESLPVTDHPFVLVSATFDIDEDGNTDYLIVVYPFDGSESATVSIMGEAVHAIPTQYMANALPYYINITEDTLTAGVLNEKFIRLVEAYKSGREMYIRMKTFNTDLTGVTAIESNLSLLGGMYLETGELCFEFIGHKSVGTNLIRVRIAPDGTGGCSILLVN